MKNSKLFFFIWFFIIVLVFPANLSPIKSVHASSNPNLFVSAENSQWNNYFAGPQVIEVIVSDPDINRLDQAFGEPVVTVNGKRLRMAQATDGNWYAYFADRNQAIAAANTVQLTGKGLNFGGFCSPTSVFSPKSGVTYADTKGFTLARGGFGSTNHTFGKITSGGFPTCTNTPGTLTVNQMEHVVRQNKTLNNNSTGFAASAGSYPNVWPIIQLYDFSGIPTLVKVDYQKNGGDQIVYLTFDRIPEQLISIKVDKQNYFQNSQVYAHINDPQLNIDPTEEDSWTWGSKDNDSSLYYQAFDRNGNPDAVSFPAAMQNLSGNLTAMMFNHNGKLSIDPRPTGIRMINFQSNGLQQITPERGDPEKVSLSNLPDSQPITFVENGGVSTGVFKNSDNHNISNVVTMDTPSITGQYTIIDYNDHPVMINTTYAPQNSSQYVIHLHNVTFTPPPVIDIHSIKNTYSTNNIIHFLFQFSRLPDGIDRDALSASGITLNDYLSGNTYLASTLSSNLDSLQNIDGVRSASVYPVSLKISPSLGSYGPMGTLTIFSPPPWAASSSNQVALTFGLHNDADVDEVKNFIQNNGGVLLANSSLPSVSAIFKNNNLTNVVSTIATDDNVRWIDYVDHPLYPLVDKARLVAYVDGPNSIIPSLGLTGKGVKVLIADAGLILHHDDLSSRILLGNPKDSDWNWHSTFVAGILGGNGAVNHDYHGVAPEVKMLLGEIMVNAVHTMSDAVSDLDSNFTESIKNGANLASMSLGTDEPSLEGQYRSTSEKIDQLVHGTRTLGPLIIFEAVGNHQQCSNPPYGSCFNSIDVPATAKNSIAVGAINTHDALMTDYSSWGPTQDGRIKPDVVTPGSHDDSEGLTSTCMNDMHFPNNACIPSFTGSDISGYGSASGTSFSTPIASGTGVLMIEAWNNTHHWPHVPLPSTVKDILIHTATMPAGIGTPNYEYGWGEINASNAIQLIYDDVSNNLIHVGTITDVGVTDVYTFNPRNNGCVKATLAWDDYPGDSTSSNMQLRNDLDLSMKDATGKVYYPFVLDPTNPSIPVSRGKDHINNVEMVTGDATSGHPLTIYVNGTQLTQPPQSYSLIVTEIPHNSVLCPASIPYLLSSTSVPPNFSLSASPHISNIVSGSGENMQLGLTSVDGFDGDIVLTVSGQSPDIFSVSMTSSVHLSSGSSSSTPVTISVNCNVPAGVYPITITAVGHDAAGKQIIHNIQIILNVISNVVPPSSPSLDGNEPGYKQRVDLRWVQPSSNGGCDIQNYVISRTPNSEVFPITVDPSSTSYDDTDISEKTTYEYTIAAKNSAGLSNPSSPPVTVTTPQCFVQFVFGEEQNHVEPTQQLQTLREFRDNSIISTTIGSDFMKVFNVWYFGLGSPIASYEKDNPAFREFMKITMYPVLYMLEYSAKTYDAIPGELGVVIFGILSSLFIGSIYVSPIALLFKKVHKNKFNYRIAIALISSISIGIVISVLINNHVVITATSWLMVLTLISISAILVAKSIYKIIQKFNMP